MAARNRKITIEIEHARRDARELRDLLAGFNPDDPDDLVRLDLMTAIGLASMTHAALLRAAAARETETPQEVFAAAVMRGDTDFDL